MPSQYETDSQEQRNFQRDMREFAASPEGQAQQQRKREQASEQAIKDFSDSSVLPQDRVEGMLRELRSGDLDIQDASKQTDDLSEQFFADSLASGLSGTKGPMDIFQALADDPFIRAVREEKAFADDPINRYGGKELVEAARAANVKNPEQFSNNLQTVAALPPAVRDELVEFATTELKTDEDRERFETLYFRQIDQAVSDLDAIQKVGGTPGTYRSGGRDPLYLEDSEGVIIPWAEATPEQRAAVSFEKGDIEKGETRQWYIHPNEEGVWRKWADFRGEKYENDPGFRSLLTREELGNVISKKDSFFTKIGITGLIGKALAPLPDGVVSKLADIGAPIYNSEFFLDVSLSDIDDAMAHPLRTFDRETELISRTAEGAVESVGYGGAAFINDTFNAATGDVNFSHTREYVDYAKTQIDQFGGFENPEAWTEFFRSESKRINIGQETALPDWVDLGAPLRFIAVPSTLIGGAQLKFGAKLGLKPAGATVKIPMTAFGKMAPDTSYRIAAWWTARHAPRKAVLARLTSEVGALRPSVPQLSQGLEAPVAGIITTTGEEVLYRGIDDVSHITAENPLASGQMLGAAPRPVVNLTPAVETAQQFASEAGDILMTRLPAGLRIIDSNSAEHANLIEKIVNSPEYAAIPVEAGGTAKQAFRDAVMEAEGISGVLIHKQGHPIIRVFDQASVIVMGGRKLDAPLNSGNNIIEHLRPLSGPDGIVNEVVTVDPGGFLWNRSILRFLVGKTGVNPSILRNSPIGRLVTAYARQIVATEGLTQVALAKAIDRHAQLVTGRLFGFTKAGGHVFQFTRSGQLTNVAGKTAGLSLHWNDVFRNPAKYLLTDSQSAVIDDVIRTAKEVEAMRVLAGLKARNILKDGFYIPRHVQGVKGVVIEGVTDPNLKRLFENAEDGVAAGIEYENDVRAVLELHVKSAYQEVAEKQLSDAVAQFGVKASDLVDNGITNKFLETATVLNEAKALSRTTLKAQENLVASVTGAARNSAQKRLEAMRVTEAAKIAELEKNAKPIFASYRNAVKTAAKTEVATGNLFGKAQDRIGIKEWHKMFYPREDVKELTRIVDSLDVNAQGFVWRQIDRTGNSIRYLASVGDFAAPFVHGLPVLARDPGVWSKATFAHYLAWIDPTVQSRFLREHRATYAKAAKYGMAMGDNEFFKGATITGGFNVDAVIKQLPIAGEPLTNFRQGFSRQTFGRFQASYNTFLIQSRVMMWEAMEESWTRNGGKLSDLAAHINNLTGGLDPRALGVMANQRSFESMWLAFSPRLLRSTVGLIADLKYGINNPRGRSAFTSLGRLVTGAAGVYSAAAMVQGHAEGKSADEILETIKEGLNPLSGKKFLSLEVNEDWIGIGGQIRAITQLMAGVASSLNSPRDFIGNDFENNPLARFWMNRGAPGPNVVGAIGEGTTNGDFLPYEDVDGLPDIALHLGKSALPFAVQARLEGENWSTVGFGLTGLRTSKQTTSEARNEAARKFNPYPEGDPRRAEVDQFGYRGLEDAEKIAFDEQYAGQFKASNNVSQQVKLGRTITQAKDTQLAELDAVVKADPFFRRQYAERRGEIMTGSAWARANVLEDKDFEADSTQGKARDLYFETLKEYQKLQPGDVLTGEEFGEAEAEAMSRIEEALGKEGVSALERSFVTGKTQTEREYRSAVQKIDDSGYWDMRDDTIEYLNSAAGQAKYGDFGFDTYSEFAEFVRADAAEGGYLPEKSAAWKLVEKLTTNARKIRRINNPELDAQLVIWFGSAPLTKESQAVAERVLGRVIQLSSDSPEADNE